MVEQLDTIGSHMKSWSNIIRKERTLKFLSDQDQDKIRIALERTGYFEHSTKLIEAIASSLPAFSKHEVETAWQWGLSNPKCNKKIVRKCIGLAVGGKSDLTIEHLVSGSGDVYLERALFLLFSHPRIGRSRMLKESIIGRAILMITRRAYNNLPGRKADDDTDLGQLSRVAFYKYLMNAYPRPAGRIMEWWEANAMLLMETVPFAQLIGCEGTPENQPIRALDVFLNSRAAEPLGAWTIIAQLLERNQAGEINPGYFQVFTEQVRAKFPEKTLILRGAGNDEDQLNYILKHVPQIRRTFLNSTVKQSQRSEATRRM